MPVVRNNKTPQGIYLERSELLALRRQATLFCNPPPGQARSSQAGGYLSRFRGRGSEFDEVRPYQPGDDTRDIDWRVSARTGRTYTKLFREERERPVWIGIDLRRPMHFGTRITFKSTLALQLATLLAWRAEQQGDRLGATLFTEAQHHELRPKRGQKAVLHLIQKLLDNQRPDATPEAQATLADAMLRLLRIAKTGTRLYLISDFHDLDDEAIKRIHQLARHNELVCLFIYDPLESQLPQGGQFIVSDGRHRLTLSDNQQLRDRYREQFLLREQRLQELARNTNIQLLAIRTDQEPLAVLRSL